MGKEVVFDRITAENVGFDLAQEAAKVARDLEKIPSFRTEIIETTARQIKTYESETLEDSVVSFYPCFIHDFQGGTKLFSSDIPHERFLIDSAIDPLERDGKALEGFKRLQEKISETLQPGLFVWISPKGSAGTQGIYKNINYRYHQIYIGEIDGKRINSYALKSDAREDVLADWLNSISHGTFSKKGQKEGDFLLNPVVLPQSSEACDLGVVLARLRNLLENRGIKFYKDLDTENLTALIRNKSMEQESDTQYIAEKLESILSSDRYVGYESAKMAIGTQLHVLYDKYANEKGEIKLMGCAGGSISINNLFRHSTGLFSNTNIFSSESRLTSSEGFICPKCGHHEDGPIGNQCPSCKITKEQWAQESGEESCE